MSKADEIWLTIKHNSNYEINNIGEVRNKKTKRILKNWKNSRGYLIISLRNRTKPYCYTLHRLVAEHFIDNPDNLPQVNHIDGNKQNNYVDNLEWISNLENQRHAIKNGLIDLELRKNNMSKLGKSKKGIKARWKMS